MKNKKLIIAAIILCIVLATTIVICRPYNNIEYNAATIYYQSYSQLFVSVSQYVGMLENYNDTENDMYLENALIKLDNIRDNITIFKIANQIDYRDTFINEKVVKTDFFSRKNLLQLASNYNYSWDVLKKLLEDKDNELENTTFKDFVHYNQLILNGLTTEDIGYEPRTKEFRVILDDSKIPVLEEGLTGLEEMVREVVTP